MTSLGSVEYLPSDRAWMVQCPPAVSVQLKRVFATAGTVDGSGRVVLSDTLDNCRNLRWFLTRYPMTVKGSDYLLRRSDEHKQREATVEAVLTGDHPVTPGMFDLAVPAREYQKLPAQLVLANGGLLLADDVGTGKTISCICMLTDPRALPCIWVCLTHLPGQMAAQINRFLPKLKVHIINRRKFYNIDAEGFRPDVVIVPYSKLSDWGPVLAKRCRSVVFDETQELRRRGSSDKPSQKYHAAKALSVAADYRIGNSATPIYNYGGEFFNVMDILFPGVLGTVREFSETWCGGSTDDKAQIASPDAFGDYLRRSGMMLRRTRKDVGRELPPCQIIEETVECNTETLEHGKAACYELARVILGDGEAFKGQKRQASEEFSNKLRQATGIAKASSVAEFVKTLVGAGEKVLLAGWHRACYDIWLKEMEHLKPAMYTGTESPHKKEQEKARFLKSSDDGGTDVMIISLRAGAGLDGLQDVCSVVVIGELDWAPGVHRQLVGRVYRDGQQKPVVAYFLLAEDGSDPIVSEVCGIKQMQHDGVVLNDGERGLVEDLQTDGTHIKKLAIDLLRRNRR